jgi:hypothetical protein
MLATDTPLNDPTAPLHISGDQLAGLLGQVEQHRAGFGDCETVVVNGRHQMETNDLTVGGPLVRPRCGPAVDAVGQPDFFRRPCFPDATGIVHHRSCRDRGEVE